MKISLNAQIDIIRYCLNEIQSLGEYRLDEDDEKYFLAIYESLNRLKDLEK